MELTTYFEAIANLRSYLRGQMSLADLYDWILGATWNCHQGPVTPLSRLAGEIELGYAELTSGDATDAELRDRWRSLAFNYNVALGSSPMPVFVTETAARNLLVRTPVPALA